jgi:hypothetical protein
MDLWETPKLLVLCELVCLAQHWTSVAAACAAKFRHIPSVLASDWGKSLTTDDISDTLCRKMFYAVAAKYGHPIPPQANEEPPAFVSVAREVCLRLREVRVRQIQEVLRAMETTTATATLAAPQVQKKMPQQSATPAPAIKKQTLKDARKVVSGPTGSLPLPMPISIMPPINSNTDNKSAINNNSHFITKA